LARQRKDEFALIPLEPQQIKQKKVYASKTMHKRKLKRIKIIIEYMHAAFLIVSIVLPILFSSIGYLNGKMNLTNFKLLIIVIVWVYTMFII
jgi:hypothetical protein